MPPIEIGTGVGLLKYAPIFFLTVAQDGKVRFNMHQIVHTLIVSGIVALVTMFGTVRVVEARMEHLDKNIDRMVSKLEAVAMKQAFVVGQADEIRDSGGPRAQRGAQGRHGFGLGQASAPAGGDAIGQLGGREPGVQHGAVGSQGGQTDGAGAGGDEGAHVLFSVANVKRQIIGQACFVSDARQMA